MIQVTVDKNPNDEKRDLYTFDTLTLDYGITVLVGCNGCGKSTLCRYMKPAFDKEGIQCFVHDSPLETQKGMDSMLFHGETSSLANYLCSSEGERLDQLFCNLIRRMGDLIHIQKTEKDLAFVIDGIDSGLSIDKIVEIKDVLHDIVLKEHPNTYLIFSANAYELASGERCIYARTGKEVSFKDYEDYKKFILKTKSDKNKRYGV